jgi:hypothetical protein
MDTMDNMKKDIELIKNKIKEYKQNGITDNFAIELKILEELPKQYDDYRNLIKRLIKSDDDSYLNKMLESLGNIIEGKQSFELVDKNIKDSLNEQFVNPILNVLEEKRKNETK